MQGQRDAGGATKPGEGRDIGVRWNNPDANNPNAPRFEHSTIPNAFKRAEPTHHFGGVDRIDQIVGSDAMSRLTIELEPEQRRQKKTLATSAGMTIKEFILSKTLTPSDSESPQPENTTARLMESPRNAQRLREAISTKTPKHLIFETTEDLKRALGIQGEVEEIETGSSWKPSTLSSPPCHAR